MSFKESIKEARLKSGLSQAKVGEAIHRTRNAIKGYEEGISSPNPDQLVALCKLYKTTPNDLLGFLPKAKEDAEMCIKEICKKAIEAIEVDIIEIKKEIYNLKHFEHFSRARKLKNIKNCRKVIEDLKQTEAQSCQ